MVNDSKPYPNLSQSWGIFGIFVAVSLLTGLAVGQLYHAAESENLSVGNFFAYNLSMLFVIWFAWRSFKNTTAKLLHFLPVSPLMFPLLILLTISFSIVLDPVTSLIPVPDLIREVFNQLGKKDIWTFLMVCITGPVLEEVLFRGIILDGFLRRYSPGKAIFWSAFLFGLFHMNPWQFIPGFLIGLMIGYIYFRTRSLTTAIFIHVVNNSFSYLIMYFYGEDIMSFRDLFTESADFRTFFLASLLVFILSLYIVYRLLIKSETEWTLRSEISSSSLPEPPADSEKQ